MFSKIISLLDSQSTFQMLTLFSDHHIGVALRYANMAAPYWTQKIYAKHFDEYLKFGKMHRLEVERCLLCLFPNTSPFLDFITAWFSTYFFIAWQWKRYGQSIWCTPVFEKKSRCLYMFENIFKTHVIISENGAFSLKISSRYEIRDFSKKTILRPFILFFQDNSAKRVLFCLAL